MGCKCKLKKLSQANLKVLVTCKGVCTEPILGDDGHYYPINVNAVLVPKKQADHWIAQGYPVTYG